MFPACKELRACTRHSKPHQQLSTSRGNQFKHSCAHWPLEHMFAVSQAWLATGGWQTTCRCMSPHLQTPTQMSERFRNRLQSQNVPVCMGLRPELPSKQAAPRIRIAHLPLCGSYLTMFV
mmetsp:Transcript_14758/g.25695  ORF Transcript_14758/g.25695 Transcript_14758/m.25695 type:complete len:120 (+) Transcript_14758:847-1206(+)